MEIEHRSYDLSVKSLDESGEFSGLLSVYNVIDEYGDVVERGAYTKTLQENGGKLPLLWQHDARLPVGSLDVSDGADGLEVKGKLLLSDDVPQAKTAYALLKAGVVRGLSIGFRAMRKKTEDKIRRLKEVKLYEGSLVTIPANRFALVSEVKQLTGIETKDFNSDLELIQLVDSNYQIMSALRSALWKLCHDRKLKKDEKIEAAAETISQFQRAFMAFLPRYLDAMEESGDMMYMGIEEMEAKFSDAPEPSRAAMRGFCETFLALESTHRSTSPEGDAAAAAPQAEEKATDADSLQSWLTATGERLRAAILA